MPPSLLRDGRRLVEVLYNDRELFRDDEPARPLETCHRHRPLRVRTFLRTAASWTPAA